MLWLYLTPILIIALNWKITWWWVARPSSPVPVAPPKPRSRRSRRAILLDERWAASTKNDGNMGPWELFQLVIIQLQLFIKLLQVLEFFGESAFLICWKMLKGFLILCLISLLDVEIKSLDVCFFFWPVLVKRTTMLFYQLCGQTLPAWRNIFVIEHGFEAKYTSSWMNLDRLPKMNRTSNTSNPKLNIADQCKSQQI